jgi:hypothetical protein
MPDFVALTEQQAYALKEWFEGRTYNPENLAEAFIKLGIRVDKGTWTQRPGTMLCNKDTGAILF